MLALFERQAQYNSWMNEKIYGVCDAIPDELRKSDMGAFFRSIHGTLNHLLLGDQLWMGRFTGKPVRFDSLGQELFEDFDRLWLARKQTDQAIEAWVDSLTEKALGGELSYTSMVGNRKTGLFLKDALLHFFHHQTHHRGQVTTMISQLDYDFGETDLILMPGVAL